MANLPDSHVIYVQPSLSMVKLWNEFFIIYSLACTALVCIGFDGVKGN